MAQGTIAVPYFLTGNPETDEFNGANPAPYPGMVGQFAEFDQGSASARNLCRYQLVRAYGNAGSATVSGSITSNTLANPTVVTTPVAHGLVTGQSILIAGNITSVPSINGVQVVTVASPTTFTVPVNCSTGGTGGTWTSVGVVPIVGGVMYWQNKGTFTVWDVPSRGGQVAGIAPLAGAFAAGGSYFWMIKRGDRNVFFIASPTSAPDTTGKPVVAVTAGPNASADCLALATEPQPYLIGRAIGAATSNLALTRIFIPD